MTITSDTNTSSGLSILTEADKPTPKSPTLQPPNPRPVTPTLVGLPLVGLVIKNKPLGEGRKALTQLSHETVFFNTDKIVQGNRAYNLFEAEIRFICGRGLIIPVVGEHYCLNTM